MFQRKYHLIIILKNGESRFFEGFYRDSSIAYWTRYKNNYLKNNPLTHVEIFPSSDGNKVDKFIVTKINSDKFIIVSDLCLKKDYSNFLEVKLWKFLRFIVVKMENGILIKF